MMRLLRGVHPTGEELALFGGGDLTFLDKLRVEWHVGSCEQCAAEVRAVQQTASRLKSEPAGMPGGVKWDRLAAEMTANIHLGLAAGECVGPAPAARVERISWRAAAVMAGLTVVLAGAWWLNPPRHQEIARKTPVEIRTSPGGIEVKENGSALMLLHTRGQQTPIIVSTPGQLRARFVDADTGQVTINNVYSD